MSVKLNGKNKTIFSHTVCRNLLVSVVVVSGTWLNDLLVDSLRHNFGKRSYMQLFVYFLTWERTVS